MPRTLWGAALVAVLAALGLRTGLHAQGNVMPPKADVVTASFSPQGEASDVQQLVLRFSRDMVRLGEGDSAPAPATLSCNPAQPQLKGRWVDTLRYVWEAPQTLAVGVRCDITLRTGLKSLDGGAVAAAGPWQLNTGGPKIVDQWPYQGGQITEQQLFFFRVNAPLDRKSLNEHLRCELKAQGAQSVVLLSEEETTTQLRKQRRDLTAAQIKNQGWIGLRCGSSDLPNDAALRLVWGKGIATPSGVSSKSDQVLGYTVRPAFTVKLTCSVLDEEKKADNLAACDPRSGLSVEFSAPVAPATLKAISLQNNSGKAINFITREDGREARNVYSTGPLAEQSALTVALSGTLRDADGRTLTNPDALNRKVAFGELPPYVGMLSAQAQLPLAPKRGEAAVWPVVARRAGAAIALQVWRVSGDSADAAPLAIAMQQAWQRMLGDNQGLKDASSAQTLLRDTSMAKFKLPQVATREVKTNNKGLEFVSLPLSEPGLYLVEADHSAARKASARSGTTSLSTALVQVTNLVVNYKGPALGNEGAALVWVTALDSGKPVSGASVALYGCDLSKPLIEGNTDAQGRLSIAADKLDAARKNGLCDGGDNVQPSVVTPNSNAKPANISVRKSIYNNDSIGFITARKDKDIALLSVAAFGAYAADNAAALSQQMMSGVLGHTVLDRMLFKAGETINMQHLLRRGTAQGFALPDALLKQPAKLQIMFGGGEKAAELPIKFDSNGSAISAWKVPANAKLGSYYAQVTLGSNEQFQTTTHSFSFQVEEYRAPVFEARMNGKQQWSAGKAELPIESSLSFLAGGAASGMNVTLRGQLSEGALAPQGYQRYRFMDDTAAAFNAAKLAAKKLTLDANGKSTHTLNAANNASLFSNARPATLNAEMEFSDANGETQTIAQPFAVWPRERKLGISAQVQPAAKASSTGGVEVSAAVLDAYNKPVNAAAVRVTAQRAQWKYGQSTPKLELIGDALPVCDMQTDAKGIARCEWRAPQDVTPAAVQNAAPGAKVVGRVLRNDQTFWILRGASNEQTSSASVQLNDWQLRFTPSDAVIQVEGIDAREPEQMLAPDSTARLLIRSPYEQSTLLLTVEREGVLTSSVHQITTREHRLELPVLGNYAPNVMLHARLIRGLHSVPESDFTPNEERMFGTSNVRYTRIMPPWPGYNANSPVAQNHTLSIRVKPSAYQLKLDVTSTQTSYQPRENAPLAITVRGADGKPAANARVTLAVVDEALLSLKENTTWAVLDALARERYSPMSALANDTGFTWRVKLGEFPDYLPPDEAQRMRSMDAPAAQLAMKSAPAPAAAAGRMMAKDASAESRQGFTANKLEEAKAEVPNTPRSNFSTLALWKTDVTTDANGKAQATVPLPDSLTRWRVVAIATHKADQFGTAETNFTTSQPLQVVSGLPLSVRSGDALTQTLTLRNTTDKPMNATLTAKATPSFARYALTKVVPAEAALRETGLMYSQTLTLAAGENRVIAWPVMVPAGAEQLKWQIAARADKFADAVEITQAVTQAAPVTVRQATLVQAAPNTEVPVAQPKGALPLQGGVSVAWQASLADAALKEVREWMKTYPFICLEQKASKLAVANDRAGWDALMQELPKYLDDKGLPRYFPSDTLPGSEVLAEYIIDVSRALGWSIPADSQQRMLNALQAALEKKLPEQDWAPTKNDTARLLSMQATLMENGVLKAPVVTLNDADKLPTIALLDWVRALLAQPASATRNAQLQDAASQLRNRYNVQGTRLNWKNEERENWWWYMWNGNAAAARTVLLVSRWAEVDASWKADLPLLVKGLTGRQQQGHWGTTTANVWGAIALQRFASSNERGAVNGSSLAQLGTVQSTVNWPAKGDPAAVMLPWQQQGEQSTLQLAHKGNGAPWATVSVMAALKLDKPTSQGMTIARSITPVQQQTKGQWRVGDVARVKLDMSSAAELSWVVVRDPVPSGATVLGRGLARESNLAQRGQTASGYAWPIYEERATDSYRGYYHYVPRGKWSVEYTLRLNNAGKFAFPASRVEAMYAPEIFAEVPVEGLEVKP